MIVKHKQLQTGTARIKDDKAPFFSQIDLHVRVSALVIEHVASRWPEISEKYFMKPLTNSLMLWGRKQQTGRDDDEHIESMEIELETCLDRLIILVNAVTVMTPKMCSVILQQGRLTSLFHMCCRARRTRSHLRSKSESLLRAIFRAMSEMSTEITSQLANIPKSGNFALRYAPGESGGLTLRQYSKLEEEEEDASRDWIHEAKTLVELLEDCQRGQLFVTCLKEFVRLRRAQNAVLHMFSSATMCNEWPKFCAQLVAYMASHVGPDVLKGSSQMLECLSTLIISLASFNVGDMTLLDLLSLCVQLLVGVLYVDVRVSEVL